MDGHPFKLALNVTAQSCQWANQASQIASYYIPKSVPTPQSETNQPSERDKWWSVANQLNWRLGELRSSMFYYLGDKWRWLWCSHWQPNIKERPNNTSTEICQTVVPILYLPPQRWTSCIVLTRVGFFFAQVIITYFHCPPPPRLLISAGGGSGVIKIDDR